MSKQYDRNVQLWAESPVSVTGTLCIGEISIQPLSEHLSTFKRNSCFDITRSYCTRSCHTPRPPAGGTSKQDISTECGSVPVTYKKSGNDLFNSANFSCNLVSIKAMIKLV